MKLKLIFLLSTLVMLFTYSANGQCYYTTLDVLNFGSNPNVVSYCDEVHYEYTIYNDDCTTTQFDLRFEFSVNANELVDAPDFEADGPPTGNNSFVRYENLNITVAAGESASFDIFMRSISVQNSIGLHDVSFLSKKSSDASFGLSDHVSQINNGHEELIDESISTSRYGSVNCEGQNDNFVIGGTLVVDKDFCFTSSNPAILREELVMLENSTILVESGSELTLDNVDLFPCDEQWNGIIVENGASLVVVGSSIDGAISGITLEEGATLELNDTEIKNCIFGLRVQGDANITQIENNQFWNNTSAGILVEDAGIPINLAASENNENVIFDSRYGVSLQGGNANIQYANIYDTETGIIGTNCSFSIAEHNVITGFLSRGIFFQRSSIRAQENTITGEYPMRMIRCTNSDIKDNTLNPSETGIFVRNSVDIELNSNDITIFNPSVVNSTGIRYARSVGLIHNNIIDVRNAEAGINASASEGIEILNNEVHGGTNSESLIAIALSSSMNSTLDANLIDGEIGQGIVVADAVSNTVECNDVTTNDNAILVADNSAFQDVIANDMTGNVDFLTRSILGLQVHHGNTFNGTNNTTSGSFALADGLSNDDVEGSLFTVDFTLGSEYRPDTRNPTDWFEDELDTGSETIYCSGNAGAQDLILPPCDYLDTLKAHKLDDPEAYWINMFHVYALYLAKVPPVSWPACVTTAWSNETVYGLKEFALMNVDLTRSLRHKRGEISTKFTDVDNSINTAQSEAVISGHISHLDSLQNLQKNEVDTEVAAQIVQLTALESSVNLFPTWKPVYLLILKELSGDTLTNAEKITLQNTASLCARTHGDVVHWARDLVAEFDSTRYHFYDHCPASGGGVSKTIKDGTLNNFAGITISPNPANNYIEVAGLSTERITHLSLLDITGRLVAAISSQDGTARFNTTELVDGVYLINFKDTDGYKVSKKVVISH